MAAFHLKASSTLLATRVNVFPSKGTFIKVIVRKDVEFSIESFFSTVADAVAVVASVGGAAVVGVVAS